MDPGECYDIADRHNGACALLPERLHARPLFGHLKADIGNETRVVVA